MNFYVYIIQSLQDNSFYKGYTLEPLKRLDQHNNYESLYTSNKTPWKLVYIEVFDNKSDALKRELALKKYGHLRINQLISSSKNKISSFLF